MLWDHEPKASVFRVLETLTSVSITREKRKGNVFNFFHKISCDEKKEKSASRLSKCKLPLLARSLRSELVLVLILSICASKYREQIPYRSVYIQQSFDCTCTLGESSSTLECLRNSLCYVWRSSVITAKMRNQNVRWNIWEYSELVDFGF